MTFAFHYETSQVIVPYQDGGGLKRGYHYKVKEVKNDTLMVEVGHRKSKKSGLMLLKSKYLMNRLWKFGPVTGFGGLRFIKILIIRLEIQGLS